MLTDTEVYRKKGIEDKFYGALYQSGPLQEVDGTLKLVIKEEVYTGKVPRGVSRGNLSSLGLVAAELGQP